MPKTMPKSNIGYRGVGADGRPVEWYYGWNPFGFGCSKNCPGCWSKRQSVRAVCPDCRAFRVHEHPERFGQPAAKDMILRAADLFCGAGT